MVSYSERDLNELKANPAFRDWIVTITTRLESVRQQIETCGKDTTVIRDEAGRKINFVAGFDYLQGAIAELRFVLNLTGLQQADLEQFELTTKPDEEGE